MAQETKIKNPMRVARNADATAFLVMDKADTGKTGEEIMGRIDYTNGYKSGERPLQQFYKFGVWLPIDAAGPTPPKTGAA